VRFDCKSPLNDPVEGIKKSVNVQRLGILIHDNDQGVIEGAGIGGTGRSNHGVALPALGESAAGLGWPIFGCTLPARSCASRSRLAARARARYAASSSGVSFLLMPYSVQRG